MRVILAEKNSQYKIECLGGVEVVSVKIAHGDVKRGY